MKSYLVWFSGNRTGTATRIIAASRNQARQIFAAQQGVTVSTYIHARAEG